MFARLIIYLTISIFLVQGGVEAQELKIKFFDKVTNEELAFVSIQGLHSGTILLADVHGELNVPQSLLLSDDSLIFFHLAYLPLKIGSKSLQGEKQREMFMEKSAINLPEFKVESSIPITLLKGILKRFYNSIPQRPYIQESFYRQVHEENGITVFLVEAACDVRFSSKKSKSPSVKVKEIRRSYSFEKNGEQHGDHLMDLLTELPYSKFAENIFLTTNYSSFDLQIVYLKDDSADFTRLIFSERVGSSTEQGQMIIRNTDMSMMSVSWSFNNVDAPDYNLLSKSSKHVWYKKQEFKNVLFHWIDDSVYVAEFHKTYLHDLLNPVFHTKEFELKESFDWIADQKIDFNSVSIKQFNNVSNLYHSKYQYNSKFWHLFEISKIGKSIQQEFEELSKEIPIITQFSRSGK